MFFIALSLLYIDPEMGGGGRFGERFKMSAQSPFWSSREFFMITWPIQTLSSVPVFLDSADPSFLNWLSASLLNKIGNSIPED